MIPQSALSVVHWVKIIVKQNMGGDTISVLIWDQLPFELRMKYDWYFKYRAALLQVQNPRAHVEIMTGKEEPKGDMAINLKKNQLRSKKSKITEVENKLQKARDSWSDLFPIEDYEPYQRACAKLFRLRNEYKEIEETP